MPGSERCQSSLTSWRSTSTMRSGPAAAQAELVGLITAQGPGLRPQKPLEPLPASSASAHAPEVRFRTPSNDKDAHGTRKDLALQPSISPERFLTCRQRRSDDKQGHGCTGMTLVLVRDCTHYRAGRRLHAPSAYTASRRQTHIGSRHTAENSNDLASMSF
jgi:hypothetical protein